MPRNLGSITETALFGDYAYLARSGDDPGLAILDISDLDNPHVMSRTDIGGPQTWRAMVSVVGDYAYISNEWHVFCYDVSNPAAPVSRGEWYINERIKDITATEDFLYLAVGMRGIIALDVSDPEDLEVAGYYNTTGSAYEVHVMGNLLVVADNTNIGIYENSLLGAPGIPDEREKPLGFVLHPAFPNPFNSSTGIGFQLPYQTHVNLSIHDQHGREVSSLLNQTLSPGAHEIHWQAVGQPSGMYYCRMDAGGFRISRGLVFVR